MRNRSRFLPLLAGACLAVAGCSGGGGGGGTAQSSAPASGPASAPAGGDTSFPRNETLYTSGTQYGPPSNWNPIREWDYATGTERSEEHTSELQSREKLVCRLLLEKNKHWPAGRRRRSA